MKCLIVDDDIVSRKKMEKILENVGECETTENGMDALAAFGNACEKNLPFDLVTLDVNMPGMDGTEVLENIRRMEKEMARDLRVKVLMVTANSDSETVLSCIQSACDDYVVKPFDRNKILQKIDTVMARASATVEPGIDPVNDNETVRFNKGRIIYKEGEKPGCAYRIVRGSVNLFRVVDNRNIVTERLQEGQMFGVCGVIGGEGGQGRTTHAMTVENCELQEIACDTLETDLDQSPDSVRTLVGSMARRLKTLSRTAAGQPSYPHFLSICQILNLIYLAHVKVPGKEAKRYKDYDLGVNCSALAKIIKSIIPVSGYEIDITLKRLYSLNLIEFSTREGTGGKLTHTFVKIIDQPKFINSAGRFYEEFKDTLQASMHRYEFADMDDFARSVDASPEIIYKKIAAGEIPENIFYIHMNAASEWLKEVGKSFFKKVKRRRLNIEDLDGVDDIVTVDNATIQECLGSIGYYKVGILAAIAGEDAREKIFGNLSANVAGIIRDEMPAEADIDEAEAADIEEEFVGLIKSMKEKAGPA